MFSYSFSSESEKNVSSFSNAVVMLMGAIQYTLQDNLVPCQSIHVGNKRSFFKNMLFPQNLK